MKSQLTFCFVFFVALGVTVTGCAPQDDNVASDGQILAGWYSEHAGESMFKPCGESDGLSVDGSGVMDLREQARKFGMQDDSPVYVRLFGVRSARSKTLEVSRVEQFGSPTPVRDCGITGVVIPNVPPAKT